MSLDSDRIPKPVGGSIDLRTLPLEPIDGFVLSRVDGRMSVKEIAATTGLPEDGVIKSVTKLQSLGVVSYDGAPPPPPPRAAPAPQAQLPPPQPPPRSASPTPAAIAPPPPRPPAASQPAITSSSATPSPPPPPPLPPAPPPGAQPLAQYDPRELEEDVDIEVEHRKKILQVFATLADVDHYTLLGVARDADKKAIKRAYFGLASEYHPDKFFRKKLGSFKGKMETIFGRITEAHDTLTNKDKRAEYDSYLGDVQTTRGIEAMMAEAQEELRRVEDIIRREMTPSPGAPAQPAPAAAPAQRPSAPPARPSAMPPPPNAADVQARRDALARRLMGGAAAKAPAPQTRPSQPPPGNPSAAKDAMDALKRRYEDRLSEAQRQQAKKYAAIGHQARANNDVIAAANAFKVALSFGGEDEELRKAYEQTAGLAEALLAESYQKQALYEERFEHWAESAKSWERVCKAKPDDPRAHERAANALAKAGGDQASLHRAADLAKRACTLEPKNAQHKVTLAQVYVAAGLLLAAKREVDAALQIDRAHPEAKALQERLAKAG